MAPRPVLPPQSGVRTCRGVGPGDRAPGTGCSPGNRGGSPETATGAPLRVWWYMKTDRTTTGIAALDTLLGGGLEIRTITQIFGEPASGKSTICMVAAVTTLRAGRPAVYLDSEGFSIERFRQIAGQDTERLADLLFLFEPLD